MGYRLDLRRITAWTCLIEPKNDLCDLSHHQGISYYQEQQGNRMPGVFPVDEPPHQEADEDESWHYHDLEQGEVVRIVAGGGEINGQYVRHYRCDAKQNQHCPERIGDDSGLCACSVLAHSRFPRICFWQ